MISSYNSRQIHLFLSVMILDDNKKSELLGEKINENLNKSMASANSSGIELETSVKLSELLANITPTKNNLIDSRDCAKPEKKVNLMFYNYLMQFNYKCYSIMCQCDFNFLLLVTFFFVLLILLIDGANCDSNVQC